MAIGDMDWLLLSILSALCLGGYDLLKKHALRDNAVPPVLFYGIVAKVLVWLPFVVLSSVAPDAVPVDYLRLPDISQRDHLCLIAKSALVSFSWIFGYFALKHLPLSTAGPIRSTGPLWTIVLAVVLFGEQPSARQWGGVVIILSAFYAFAWMGKREGIHFGRNRWVWYMLGATILGACSSIYDKYLLQRLGLEPTTVQAWFSMYLVVVLLPFYIGWKCRWWSRGHSFTWKWSVPLVGIGLLVADMLYFTAIRHPEALISVISPVRRMSVVITFLAGVIFHKERSNVRWKLCCLVVLLVGVFLLR